MKQTIHNNYDLSIRFAPDGFYLLVSENKNRILSKKIPAEFNSLTESQIIDLLAKEPELQMIFKSVRLMYQTLNYTFVPMEFFRETEAADFLKLQHHDIKKTDTILFNLLEPWEAVCVFSIPAHLHTVLSNFLPEINIEHYLTTLLTDEIVMQNGKTIHILIGNADADYIVLHDNKLLFANSFGFSTAEDIAYHTLNIATQLQLATDECSLTIHGNENQQGYKELLSKYFEKCYTSKLSF